MQYIKMTAITLGVLAQATALSADPSWDGFYAGISLDAARTNASVSGTAAHNRKSQVATLGAYAGFNKTVQGGLVWGAELGLSPVEKLGNRSGGGVGTTEFNGTFMLTPRLRAGFATGNLFVYGLAGATISNAVVRSAGATTKDYAMGLTYGVGAEMKLSDQWSTRIDITRTELGQRNQSFGAVSRNTKVKIDKISLGLTRRF